MVKSPVDKVADTILVEEFDSSEVIELYRKDYKIDVGEYFPQDKFQLRRCSKTNYRFFYPQTLEGKEQLYIDLHNNRPSYYRFPKWEHQAVISAIEKLEIKTLLEVGCATGDFISYLKENTPIEASGIELNRTATEIGRARGLKIHDEIIEDHSKKGLKYDLICSFQVVEHIYDIHSFFSNSVRLLNKKGYIIFGVPHSNPYLYYFDKLHTLNLPPHHVGLWDKKTIQNIAKNFNLEVVDVQIEEPSIYEISEIIKFWRNSERLKYRASSLVARGFIKVGKQLRVENFTNKILTKMIKGRNILGILKTKD